MSSLRDWFTSLGNTIVTKTVGGGSWGEASLDTVSFIQALDWSSDPQHPH